MKSWKIKKTTSLPVKRRDVVVVGGGISGVAVAYGLTEKGCKVTVLDGPTATNKASRTNVGLIWCQSKFLHEPEYAKWGFLSARLFPELTRELEEVSGLHIPVNYQGGLIACLGEEEFEQRGSYIEKLRTALGEYNGGMLDRSGLEKKLPKIRFGPDVTGAAWCEEDGIVEPLILLRAFKLALNNRGAEIRETLVREVKPMQGGGYRVMSGEAVYECERVVLAAGLANRRLANFAVQDIPVHADKGQVLLVERMPYVMPTPILGVTQTFGGTIIIGFRHEFVGHDTGVVPEAVSTEGTWALRVWPELGKKRLIRTWSGLRVMPKDGVAIYSRLPGHPNAVLINAHSAVTLAAAQTRLLADYILGGNLPDTAGGMTLKRFGFDC